MYTPTYTCTYICTLTHTRIYIDPQLIRSSCENCTNMKSRPTSSPLISAPRYTEVILTPYTDQSCKRRKFKIGWHITVHLSSQDCGACTGLSDTLRRGAVVTSI